MKTIYVDNNATTPVLASVRKRMNSVLEESFGNPSSLYKPARNSALILSMRSAVSSCPGDESVGRSLVCRARR